MISAGHDSARRNLCSLCCEFSFFPRPCIAHVQDEAEGGSGTETGQYDKSRDAACSSSVANTCRFIRQGTATAGRNMRFYYYFAYIKHLGSLHCYSVVLGEAWRTQSTDISDLVPPHRRWSSHSKPLSPDRRAGACGEFEELLLLPHPPQFLFVSADPSWLLLETPSKRCGRM